MKNIHEFDILNQPDKGDSLVWLHEHRNTNAKKYPTVEALSDCLRQFHSVEDSLADTARIGNVESEREPVRRQVCKMIRHFHGGSSPPGFHGLQRQIRHIPLSTPRMTPYLRIASII